MRVKIEGTKYSRDLTSMAVVCDDLSVVRAYNAELLKNQADKRRDSEINKLKQEVSEIKSMIQFLIDRGQNG